MFQYQANLRINVPMKRIEDPNMNRATDETVITKIITAANRNYRRT
jgi:hypothetical protein